MNWKFLLSTSLAFSIIFVILMTIALYFKFKSDSQKKNNEETLDPNEGRYFKKFQINASVPSHSQQSHQQSAHLKRQAYAKVVFYVPFVILGLLSAYLWMFHQNLFHDRVRLTGEELSELKIESRQWKVENSPLRPHLSQVFSDLRRKKIVLVISKAGLNFKIPGVGRRISSEALASWEIWLEKNQLKYYICSEEKLTHCLKGNNRIYVLLPDFWKSEDLDAFNSRSFRTILSGAPHQVYLDSESWSWRDLQFRKDTQPEKGLIALPTDKELTLGWNPGELLSIKRFFGGVNIQTNNNQGYRLTESLKFSDQPEASMWVSNKGSGARLVWMDFLPTEKEADLPQVTNDLMSSIFRYLLGKEYSAVAAWPNEKNFPLGVAINIDEFNSELRGLNEEPLPLTFFSFSSFLEDNRSAISTVKDKGDLYCLSDKDRSFDRETLLDQAKSMALCLKTLKDLTGGSSTSGLQPPNEKYNEETYSAAAHFGLDFLFVQHLKQFAPQSFRDLKSSYSLNLIPRMFSDDFFFFKKNLFSSSDIERLIHKEISIAQSMGVPYIYRTQSSRLKEPVSQKIFEIIRQVANDQGSWKTSLTQLSHWWRVHSNLNAGIRLSESDFKMYKPSIVRVNKAGTLIKTALRPGQDWRSAGGGHE